MNKIKDFFLEKYNKLKICETCRYKLACILLSVALLACIIALVM